jgi:hypothetical protein
MQQDLQEFPNNKKKLLHVLFLNLNPFNHQTLLFYFYGPQGIKPFLISSQGGN